jgi:hypothetical protein
LKSAQIIVITEVPCGHALPAAHRSAPQSRALMCTNLNGLFYDKGGQLRGRPHNASAGSPLNPKSSIFNLQSSIFDRKSSILDPRSSIFDRKS